jgi:glucose-6-phosphate isomerase
MTSAEAETGLIDPSKTRAWKELAHLAQQVGSTSIRQLFEDDPNRTAMVAQGAGLTFDYSRQRLTPEVLEQLLKLAQECGVTQRRSAMFAGERINSTEGRSVLHTALRLPRNEVRVVDGSDVVPQVHDVLDRMEEFAEAVRNGTWTGASGKRIRTIINIGIGGSDLGPAMAYRALHAFSDPELTFHFVSNVDPSDLAEALEGSDPAETLFIVASKTFTTQETLVNALAARGWMIEALGADAVAQHFVAISTGEEPVRKFGIPTENMFGFWDWVGGRYSMDSAIGLSTMVAIGPARYRELLAGFHAMDVHFLSAPDSENVPLLMALIGIWNRNFLNIASVAVLPYAHSLARFPAYLQQLTMESNGKSVRHDGTTVEYATGALYWGEPGTNGQHSFFQFLHQGTDHIACDILLMAQNVQNFVDQQDMLIANGLAQAAVLALGRSEEDVRKDGAPAHLVPHKVMPGNNPTSVIMAAKLDPFTLGALVSLYEHMVFVQGAIWGINSFDQWGVELGKRVTTDILAAMKGETDSDLDSATLTTLERISALQRD